MLHTDFVELRSELGRSDWDPEGNAAYPLDEEEARVLIRGMNREGQQALRVFCKNFDGTHGLADLSALFSATGFSHYDDLGHEISNITQRLRSVTQNSDAWLFNWRAKDWEWDEGEGTYVRGSYFIGKPAIDSLRKALSIPE